MLLGKSTQPSRSPTRYSIKPLDMYRASFSGLLLEWGIKVSMDGKGRYLDNIFVERLWRSVKYEEVYLKAYSNGSEARRGIDAYLELYNRERPHQSLDYRTPAQVFASGRPFGCLSGPGIGLIIS